MNLLDTVEEAANHVVSAGSLAAGKDDADVDWLAGSCQGVLLEFYFRKAVGVWEECTDGILVGNGLSGLAFDHLYRAGESYRELGLVRGAGFL